MNAKLCFRCSSFKNRNSCTQIHRARCITGHNLPGRFTRRNIEVKSAHAENKREGSLFGIPTAWQQQRSFLLLKSLNKSCIAACLYTPGRTERSRKFRFFLSSSSSFFCFFFVCFFQPLLCSLPKFSFLPLFSFCIYIFCWGGGGGSTTGTLTQLN